MHDGHLTGDRPPPERNPRVRQRDPNGTSGTRCRTPPLPSPGNQLAIEMSPRRSSAPGPQMAKAIAGRDARFPRKRGKLLPVEGMRVPRTMQEHGRDVAPRLLLVNSGSLGMSAARIQWGNGPIVRSDAWSRERDLTGLLLILDLHLLARIVLGSLGAFPGLAGDLDRIPWGGERWRVAEVEV